ncbi:ufd-1 [Pristionchus pacificus]|uniref:Ufd-1 n=1 Tax=Pristionchus pacificus TaxID=54126 RepID=A0A2A6CBU9_PRIPA|nr:ufd-1 [Pristionchus pacificus]|eukprot:PDM75619.1 ufd-1 [Pristionchus pacificus]
MMNWLADGMVRGGMGGPGIPFGMGMGRFAQSIKAFSAPFYEGADAAKINEINYGGKILLPSSALDVLIRLNIQYPMLFKLTNTRNGSMTHCGVLEFSAEEGKAYLPQWIMQQLRIDEGQIINIESASLPKATFARLKPQNIEFLQVTNMRAMLEVELRKFACLTEKDRIAVRYNDQTLEFLVMELKPNTSVCIIECDVNLEFDEVEGYKAEEESRKNQRIEKPAAPPMEMDEEEEDEMPEPTKKFAAFGGSGARLDGKIRRGGRTESTSSVGGTMRDEKDKEDKLPKVKAREDYVPGTISFPRYDYKCRVVMEKELEEKAKAAAAGGAAGSSTSAFEGRGTALRARK